MLLREKFHPSADGELFPTKGASPPSQTPSSSRAPCIPKRLEANWQKPWRSNSSDLENGKAGLWGQIKEAKYV